MKTDMRPAHLKTVDVAILGAETALGRAVARTCRHDRRVGQLVCVHNEDPERRHLGVDVVVANPEEAASDQRVASCSLIVNCLGPSTNDDGEDHAARTLRIARAVAAANPAATFVQMSNAGADTRSGSARRRAEAAADLALVTAGLGGLVVMRPRHVQHGRRNPADHWGERFADALARPWIDQLARRWPGRFTTDVKLARAIIAIAIDPQPGLSIHYARDINALAESAGDGRPQGG